MAVPERDSTQEWMLPEERRPPLIGELEGRIEEALATARASEAAVMSVGAAALDAAEQARRAAKLAERAASSAAEASSAVQRSGSVEVRRVGDRLGGPGSEAVEEAGDDTLSDFDERADRLMERLRRLQRVPLGPASSAAAPRQARP